MKNKPIFVDFKELLKELKDNSKDIETPSKEWFTTRMLAVQTGIKLGRAGVLIKNGIRSGKLEMAPFKIKCGKLVRAVPHYRKIQ